MFRAQITMTPETRAMLDDLAATNLKPVAESVVIEAMSPAVARIKARISTMPSRTTHNGESLRAALARSVTRTVRKTARGLSLQIGITMQGGKENLARAVEGIIPWRHPVYGNEPDQDQDPYPFFSGPAESAAAAIDYKLQAAIDARLGL